MAVAPPFGSRLVTLRPLIVALALTCATFASLVHARDPLVSDPTRLGAFMGAMRYCEDRYEEREGRYRLTRLRVAKEVNRMSSDERLRALAASRISEERGTFLGNRLDKRECRALLSMSEWKRFVN